MKTEVKSLTPERKPSDTFACEPGKSMKFASVKSVTPKFDEDNRVVTAGKGAAMASDVKTLTPEGEPSSTYVVNGSK